MKLDLKKIITLANGEEYLIIDKITKEETDYYYVAELNKEETDIKDNYKIITVEEEGENKLVNEVLGEKNLKEILPLFIK